MAATVFVHGISWLLRSGATFLGRSALQLRPFETPTALFRALAREVPDVVAANLDLSRSDFDALTALLAQPRCAHVGLVLATRRSAVQRQIDRATRAHPKVRLITGPERIRARVLEAIAEVLGVAPRHHWRYETLRPVSLVPHPKDLPPGRLYNLSETGAKVWLPKPVSIGATLEIAFKLSDGPFQATCEVVRTTAVPGESTPALGVHFVDLPAAESLRLRHELDAAMPPPPPPRFEPPRATRFALPKSLALTARLRKADDARVSYLKVRDLSEGGFGAVAKGYQPPFQAGDVLHAELLAGSLKLTCSVEVIRLVKLPSDAGSEVGLRFTRLLHREHSVLMQLLAHARSGQLQAVAAGG